MNDIQKKSEIVPDELQHYGVLGMKWGVRRYQNYDGSYTKKGMERYRKAESRYNKSKEDREKTKTAYKNGTATIQEFRSAKSEVKRAKHDLDKSYARLKTDKMADEGKKLYAQGKTITDNRLKSASMQTAIVVGSSVVNYFLSTTFGDQRIANTAASTIAIGGSAVNAMLAMKTSSENKKLRAYYGHH